MKRVFNIYLGLCGILPLFINCGSGIRSVPLSDVDATDTNFTNFESRIAQEVIQRTPGMMSQDEIKIDLPFWDRAAESYAFDEIPNHFEGQEGYLSFVVDYTINANQYQVTVVADLSVPTISFSYLGSDGQTVEFEEPTVQGSVHIESVADITFAGEDEAGASYFSTPPSFFKFNSTEPTIYIHLTEDRITGELIGEHGTEISFDVLARLTDFDQAAIDDFTPDDFESRDAYLDAIYTYFTDRTEAGGTLSINGKTYDFATMTKKWLDTLFHPTAETTMSNTRS